MMQTGGREGMIMLNDALLKLVMDGTVAADEAMAKAVDKKDFNEKLKVAGIVSEYGSAWPGRAASRPAENRA